MDNGENDAAIPGVDASQLETACLKLAELPEAYAGSPGGKGKNSTNTWTTT